MLRVPIINKESLQSRPLCAVPLLKERLGEVLAAKPLIVHCSLSFWRVLGVGVCIVHLRVLSVRGSNFYSFIRKLKVSPVYKGVMFAAHGFEISFYFFY